MLLLDFFAQRTKANKGYIATKSCCKPCQNWRTHMSPASLLPTFPTSSPFSCPFIFRLSPRTFCVYPFSCVYPCACVILTAILMKRETVEIQFVQQGKTQRWQTHTRTRIHAHPFTYKKQPKFLLRRLGLGSKGPWRALHLTMSRCQQQQIKMAPSLLYFAHLLFARFVWVN